MKRLVLLASLRTKSSPSKLVPETLVSTDVATGYFKLPRSSGFLRQTR